MSSSAFGSNRQANAMLIRMASIDVLGGGCGIDCTLCVKLKHPVYSTCTVHVTGSFKAIECKLCTFFKIVKG